MTVGALESNEYRAIYLNDDFPKTIGKRIQDTSSTLNESYRPVIINKVLTSIGITIINSIAMAFFSKIVAVGCFVVSVVAHARFIKMINHEMRGLELLMSKISGLGQCVKYLNNCVPIAQCPLVFIQDLKFIEENLSKLQDGSEKESWESKKLEIEKKKSAFIKNSQFAKEHKKLLTKVADIFLKVAQAARKRMEACKDFMFFSSAGVFIISVSLDFYKHEWVKVDLFTRILLGPYMLTVGTIAVVYALKQLYNIIAHSNDIEKERPNFRLLEQDIELAELV